MSFICEYIEALYSYLIHQSLNIEYSLTCVHGSFPNSLDEFFETKKNSGSISVSEQLPTYPSPNPTLTVVGLGEG